MAAREVILLTGSSGLLGSRCYPHLAERWTVVGTALEPPAGSIQENFVRCDLTDPDASERMVREVNPDVLLHAAAQKDIEACEEERDACWELNVEATRRLATLAGSLGRFFVFISSDYVFDGRRGRYAEDDEPAPTLHYGETKAVAEGIVRETGGAVCRTSGLYGWDSPRPTFVEFVVDRLQRGRPTELYEDSYNSPTYVGNLCEMLESVIELRRARVYHTAGSDRASRYDFGCEIARAFGLDGSVLEPSARPTDVDPVRPADVSLAVERSRDILDVPFLGVTEGLKRLREDHGL